MKIQIAKKPLYESVSRLQGVIADRNLATIAIKAENDKISFFSEDRIIAVFSNYKCEVLESGTIFVPGRLFSEIIRECPEEGMVNFETDQSFLYIKAGVDHSFVMKIPLLLDQVWINPPDIETDNVAELEQERVLYLINQVQFCVAQDSPRNFGTVGYLHRPKPNVLRLVGTDNYRLSYCEMNVSTPDGFLRNGICLSKRALVEIERMCQERAQKNIEFFISRDETTLVLVQQDQKVFIRLSAVKYPNYLGVIPSAYLNIVAVDRQLLQNVSRRVLLASDKTKALQLCFDRDMLTLVAKSSDGEGKESISLEGYRGQKTELLINGKFLNDVFSNIQGDDVTLQFKTENDPIVVIPKKEPPNCKSLHILVPIKEQENT